MDGDVRRDAESRKPQSSPAESKQNPHDPTVANKKDLERIRSKKEVEID